MIMKSDYVDTLPATDVDLIRGKDHSDNQSQWILTFFNFLS